MIKVIQARTDTVLTMKCARVNLVLTTAYGGGGAIIIIPTLQMRKLRNREDIPAGVYRAQAPT